MISLAVAKARLGIADTDTTRDDLLTALIGEITATLSRDILDWVGSPKAFEEVRSGRCCGRTDTLTLSQKPITPSETYPMTVSTRANAFGEFELLEATEWTVHRYDVIGRQSWPEGVATVKANYWAGYPVDTGPEELRALVHDALGLAFNAATGQSGDSGMKSERLGDYDYTRFGPGDFGGAFATQWQATAARWRRRLV